MRYLPNLIPEDSRVLKNYFKGDIYRSQKKKGLLGALGWLFGIFFLLGTFAELPHPPLAFLYGLLGVILLPPGHHWIEKTLRFRFRTKTKTIFGVTVFICAVPLIVYYGAIDRAAYAQTQLKAAREKEEKQAAAAREQQRNDSLIFYLQATDLQRQGDKIAGASAQLQRAAAFATTPSDKDHIAKEEDFISILRINDMIASGRYKKAIPELNILIAHIPDNADLFFNRAFCYSRTGHMEEAVHDCKSAADLGNKEAEQLNDKINPVMKRVSGYMTQCCDGSYSDAKGREACSHHGGVCNCNSPTDEQYRKYE